MQEHAGDRLVIALAVAVHAADALVVAADESRELAVEVDVRAAQQQIGRRGEMRFVGPFLRAATCARGGLRRDARSRRRKRIVGVGYSVIDRVLGRARSATGPLSGVAWLGLRLLSLARPSGAAWRTPSSTWSANCAKFSTNRSTSFAAIAIIFGRVRPRCRAGRAARCRRPAPRPALRSRNSGPCGTRHC